MPGQSRNDERGNVGGGVAFLPDEEAVEDQEVTLGFRDASTIIAPGEVMRAGACYLGLIAV